MSTSLKCTSSTARGTAERCGATIEKSKSGVVGISGPARPGFAVSVFGTAAGSCCACAAVVASPAANASTPTDAARRSERRKLSIFKPNPPCGRHGPSPYPKRAGPRCQSALFYGAQQLRSKEKPRIFPYLVTANARNFLIREFREWNFILYLNQQSQHSRKWPIFNGTSTPRPLSLRRRQHCRNLNGRAWDG